MLERIPKTRAVIDDPKNERHKQMLEAAIKAQTPILEETIRKMSPRGSPKSPHEAISLWMVSARTGPSLELRNSLGGRLPIPVTPSNDVVGFAYEVARAWDGTRNEDMAGLGVPESYAKRSTAEHAFFSLQGASNLRMEILLAETLRFKAHLQDSSLLSDFIAGKVPFDAVKDHFERFHRIRLLEAQVHQGSSFSVLLLGDKGEKMNLNPQISLPVDTKRFMRNVYHVAKRMSLGFNPIW